MRYSEDEATILVGQFKTGLSVSMKILDLNNDAEIPTTNISCRESKVMPGIYLWSTARIDKREYDGFKSLLYEMTSSEGDKYYGKFVYGGYPDLISEITINGNSGDNSSISNEDIYKILKIINGRL